ncbi:MAG: hypothetical protein F6K22_36920 [Okeania sp. SIO2F4]|uniref:transposase n=1 Tax=Okeania sp. SIO2F4 TaxID=2607790 RepID=UPI00142B8B20|nr:transposase [Okeania sp. SIO2F4]NES07885.1 hypothetical protein [Okeania sp. SIO2F4]
MRNAHQAVADIRADALHKVTTWLAKNHSTIVIEDLNVSGMLKKRSESGAFRRMGWRGLPKNAEPLRSAPYPIDQEIIN